MEAAYVLMSVYRVPRAEVVDALIAFVEKENVRLVGMSKTAALQGLELCRPSGRVSVADALIWASARSSATNVVYSFDERFPTDGVEVRRTLRD